MYKGWSINKRHYVYNVFSPKAEKGVGQGYKVHYWVVHLKNETVKTT